MNDSDQSCNEKAGCLKRQLENLSKLELIQKFKEDIEEAEKEKNRLKTLRNTLAFLRSKQLLVRVNIEDFWGEKEPTNAQRIPAQTKSFLGDREKIKSKTASVVVIILVAMCAVMIFLLLNSWIEINGVPVSLFGRFCGEGSLSQNRFFSTAMTYVPEIVPFLIIVGLASLCVCATLYVFFIIKVCQRKETKAPYVAMLCVIVVFIFLICVTQTIVFYTEQAAGSVPFMRTGMTIKAWMALFLACTLGIGYYKRRMLASIFGKKDIVWEELLRIYSITNYYPWKSIRFLSCC